MATLSEVFTNIANAIRSKTGKTATMTPAGMVVEIDKLADVSNDTVTADALTEGVTAHDKSGNPITGANPYEKTETDAEVLSQSDLLDQTLTALKGKAAGDGGTDNGVLPIGYTPVPCIKFTGQQAVDTGIICNQDTQIRAVCVVDGDGGRYLWGVTNDANTASITAYRSNSGGYWRFGDQKISLITESDAKTVWYVEVNKKRIIRGTVESTYSNVNDFTAEAAMVLGGRYANETIEEATLLIGRVVLFEMYAGDNLVLSFVPCKNAEGVCGFWDKVTRRFFASSTATPLEWDFI